MKEYNIIEDISKLTHIKQFNLRKIASLYELDIANCIYESISDDSEFKLDIGIGYLTISLLDDSIIYKFEPSKKLIDVIYGLFDEVPPVDANKF